MAGTLPSTSETRVDVIVQAIRELFFGRSLAVGELTLTANAATTTVTVPFTVGASSIITLTPRTANAAAALATTYITVANTTRGQFVINHANNAQTDKSFGYTIAG